MAQNEAKTKNNNIAQEISVSDKTESEILPERKNNGG